jgi:hypothetical protein
MKLDDDSLMKVQRQFPPSGNFLASLLLSAGKLEDR